MLDNNKMDHGNSKDFSLLAQNLSKTYKNAIFPAVDDFTLAIMPGEIFGLLGPNGAGKTTAISMMSSILKPDCGHVLICGLDLFKSPLQAKKLFGLVPQDIALYSNLTIKENLAYFGKLYGLRGKKLRNRIQRSLEMAGLENKANQRISICSGGMKRRANLAAGFLHHPRVLFLDEPTVGIDAQSRNMILEKVSLLQKDGVAIIYTTHYMEEAEFLCSRVAIIDSGKILTQGNTAELLHQYPACQNLGELFLHLTGKHLRD